MWNTRLTRTQASRRQWRLSLVGAMLLILTLPDLLHAASVRQPAAQPDPTQPDPAPTTAAQPAQEAQSGEETPLQEETPESVASRYMEATRRADWATCARLMHPDALQQLK